MERKIDKAIWYTLGWEWLGFRGRFLIWLARQLYRIGIFNEEQVKKCVNLASSTALARKAKEAGLRIKLIKIERRQE